MFSSRTKNSLYHFLVSIVLSISIVIIVIAIINQNQFNAPLKNRSTTSAFFSENAYIVTSGPTTLNPTKASKSPTRPTTRSPTTADPTFSPNSYMPSYLPTVKPTHKPSETPSKLPTSQFPSSSPLTQNPTVIQVSNNNTIINLNENNTQLYINVSRGDSLTFNNSIAAINIYSNFSTICQGLTCNNTRRLLIEQNQTTCNTYYYNLVYDSTVILCQPYFSQAGFFGFYYVINQHCSFIFVNVFQPSLSPTQLPTQLPTNLPTQ